MSVAEVTARANYHSRAEIVTLPISLPRLEAYTYREHDESPSFLQGVTIEDFLPGSIPLPKVQDGSISLPRVQLKQLGLFIIG